MRAVAATRHCHAGGSVTLLGLLDLPRCATACRCGGLCVVSKQTCAPSAWLLHVLARVHTMMHDLLGVHTMNVNEVLMQYNFHFLVIMPSFDPQYI